MTHLHTRPMAAGLLAALLAIGTPLAALAHGHAHDGSEGRATTHMAQRHAQHLTQLQTKLKLTPEQSAQWSAFAQAMQPPASRTNAPQAGAALRTMTTPERIDHMQAQRGQRQAQMDKRWQATRVFYGQLSAEQKTTFDQETHAHWQRHMGQHMRRHGHHVDKHAPTAAPASSPAPVSALGQS